MKSCEIQKKLTKNILIILGCALLVTLSLVIGGGCLIEQDNYVSGGILVGLGIFLFLGGCGFCIGMYLKQREIIFDLQSQEILEQYREAKGNKDFETLNGKILTFENTFMVYDGRHLNYRDYECYASTSHLSKPLYTEINLSLSFVSNEEVITIPLNLDSLHEIEQYEIVICNQEDLDYFFKYPERCLKTIHKKLIFTPKNCLPLSFSKNQKEKKSARRKNVSSMLGFALGISFLILLNCLIIWLSDSKTGVQIASKMGVHWLFKGLFTIALFALIFIKAKKVKWYGKLTILAFIIFYWVTLFLSGQAYWFVISAFSIIFLIIGLITADKKDFYNSCVNRFTLLFFFLIFLLFENFIHYSFQNESTIWIVGGILAGIFGFSFLIAVFIFHLYEKKKEKEINKGRMILYYIASCFGGLMLGFTYGIGLVSNLNYALDFSQKEIKEYVIEELKMESDNMPDKAIITIDGIKIEIAISRQEYYDLEVGDSIPISFCEGFFHIPYYLWE